MKEQEIKIAGYTLREMVNYKNERSILIESPEADVMETSEDELGEWLDKFFTENF